MHVWKMVVKMLLLERVHAFRLRNESAIPHCTGNSVISPAEVELEQLNQPLLANKLQQEVLAGMV